MLKFLSLSLNITDASLSSVVLVTFIERREILEQDGDTAAGRLRIPHYQKHIQFV